MKYYELKLDTKRNVIGAYEQIINVSFSKDPFSKDSFNNQGIFGPVTGNPPIPSAYFNKKSKVTDYVNFIAITQNKYLVISERLYLFLKERFLRQPHQTWDTTLDRNGQKLPYKILHIDYPEKDFVNYKKSVFKFVVSNSDGSQRDLNKFIEIHSDEHIHEVKKQYPPYLEDKPFIRPSRLSFNLSQMDADIFRTAAAYISGYYVSETFKNVIEKEGFTGMGFTPVEELSHHYEIEIV
ncbi:hypothetical protein [Ascidiimonas aurantiaca]|uniref:hypothetical protein n=1 Tax=Ascidiimonas aurantiaca TaxID=1685432 RepID=UPI0030EE155A